MSLSRLVPLAILPVVRSLSYIVSLLPYSLSSFLCSLIFHSFLLLLISLLLHASSVLDDSFFFCVLPPCDSLLRFTYSLDSCVWSTSSACPHSFDILLARPYSTSSSVASLLPFLVSTIISSLVFSSHLVFCCFVIFSPLQLLFTVMLIAHCICLFSSLFKFMVCLSICLSPFLYHFFILYFYLQLGH